MRKTRLVNKEFQKDVQGILCDSHTYNKESMYLVLNIIAQ